MDFKVLLIQIRQNEDVAHEEKLSFSRYSGLKLSQIHTFDVFGHPNFDYHLLKNYQACFIGGASEASVLEPDLYNFVPSLINLVQYCIQNDFPVFASCFGFQVAVLALGGKITKNSESFEMGTYAMRLSKAAKHDPVFKGSPDGFYAISVHQESCTSLPEDCELLARTESCIHAFKVKDKRFWAFQFHPELDKQNLITRLKAYQEKYTTDDGHYNSVIDSLQETPFSNILLKKFINYLTKAQDIIAVPE